MSPDLLTRLQCPVTGQTLAPARDELVTCLNERIATRELTNRAGDVVIERLDGALMNASGTVCYAIRGDITWLQAEEAIAIESLEAKLHPHREEDT